LRSFAFTLGAYTSHEAELKGSGLPKNRSTILLEPQEAMVARGLLGHEQEFLDSLHVMEEGMRHFYGEADEPPGRRSRGGLAHDRS